MSRLTALQQFYGLLEQLEMRHGGHRLLTDLSHYRDWPTRGVYFFFDPEEPRRDSGAGPRVVRVGTHALTDGSKSTLRQRLGQHRGKLSGGGNHRGSIFRLLVGQALLAAGGQPPCPSWGVKGDKRKACEQLGMERAALDAQESPIEQAVSDYLSRLTFLWLDVGDAPSQQSLRGVVEQQSLALLSNHNRPALDPPSANWLGHHSDRVLVRESGLWNQRHVGDRHRSDFLALLAELIHQTL